MVEESGLQLGDLDLTSEEFFLEEVDCKCYTGMGMMGGSCLLMLSVF